MCPRRVAELFLQLVSRSCQRSRVRYTHCTSSKPLQCSWLATDEWNSDEVEIHKYADGVVAETAGIDQDLIPYSSRCMHAVHSLVNYSTQARTAHSSSCTLVRNSVSQHQFWDGYDPSSKSCLTNFGKKGGCGSKQEQPCNAGSRPYRRCHAGTIELRVMQRSQMKF